MINAVSQNSTRIIQSTNDSSAPKNLSEGQALQSEINEPRFDTIELNEKDVKGSPLLNVPNEMTSDKPRSWSIAMETLDSRINHIESSIKKS